MRRISPSFRDKYPQIPWDAIAGMRNKIVHDYMDVDEDIVWDSVMHESFQRIWRREVYSPQGIFRFAIALDAMGCLKNTGAQFHLLDPRNLPGCW